MKSWVMALYMASISAGNAFTAATSAVIGAARLDVSGASYYAFFTCVMLVAALLFLPVARCYKVADHVPGRVRIGDESSDEPERGDARAHTGYTCATEPCEARHPINSACIWNGRCIWLV